MEQRVTKSIKIYPDLWKEMKIRCVREDTEISTYLEKIIKKNLEKKKSRENQ